MKIFYPIALSLGISSLTALAQHSCDELSRYNISSFTHEKSMCLGIRQAVRGDKCRHLTDKISQKFCMVVKQSTNNSFDCEKYFKHDKLLRPVSSMTQTKRNMCVAFQALFNGKDIPQGLDSMTSIHLGGTAKMEKYGSMFPSKTAYPQELLEFLKERITSSESYTGAHVVRRAIAYAIDEAGEQGKQFIQKMMNKKDAETQTSETAQPAPAPTATEPMPVVTVSEAIEAPLRADMTDSVFNGQAPMPVSENTCIPMPQTPEINSVEDAEMEEMQQMQYEHDMIEKEEKDIKKQEDEESDITQSIMMALEENETTPPEETL